MCVNIQLQSPPKGDFNKVHQMVIIGGSLMMKGGHGQTNQLHDILIGVHSTMHLVHPN